MQVDYIIVGQGICGTFLSWELIKEGKKVLVIDDGKPNSPSRIAAGIINPVTGRRLATTWMAEHVFPHAWEKYNSIGALLGITAITQRNLIDFFPNPFMKEGFEKRLAQNNPYVSTVNEAHNWQRYFSFDFGCGEIRPVYTAHLQPLLIAWQQYLLQRDSLLAEHFEEQYLKLHSRTVEYKSITAEKIIFCDGTAGADSKFFGNLPFALNKGEALIVEIPDLPDTHVYKKSLLLAPLPAKNTFWAGSNYIWDFEDDAPSDIYFKDADFALKNWLQVPYKIVDKLAAVRPATVERRPFAGLHPEFPQVGILNGMGTKGSSLAPFFATQLALKLLYENEILPEAGIDRYKSVLSRK